MLSEHLYFTHTEDYRSSLLPDSIGFVALRSIHATSATVYVTKIDTICMHLWREEIAPARRTMRDLFQIMETSRTLAHLLPQYLDKTLFERYVRHLLLYEQLRELLTAANENVIPTPTNMSSVWDFTPIDVVETNVENCAVVLKAKMDAHIYDLRRRFGTLYKYLQYRYWSNLRVEYRRLEQFVAEQWTDIKKTQHTVARQRTSRNITMEETVSKYFKDYTPANREFETLMSDLVNFQEASIMFTHGGLNMPDCIRWNRVHIESSFIEPTDVDTRPSTVSSKKKNNKNKKNHHRFNTDGLPINQS